MNIDSGITFNYAGRSKQFLFNPVRKINLERKNRHGHDNNRIFEGRTFERKSSF